MSSKNSGGLALAKPKAPVNPVIFARAGEGVPADVQVSLAQAVGGVPYMTFALDLSKVQVPSRRFFADALQVVDGDNCLHLCFGQKKLFPASAGEIRLRAMLDVVMVNESLSQFVNSLVELDWAGVKAGVLSTFEEEPAQTVPLNATFVATSMGPEECCMDFYHGSPFELSAIAHGQKQLHLDPVVRVTLPSSLFRSLVQELRLRDEAVKNSRVEAGEK